jgi:hypothetical protein
MSLSFWIGIGNAFATFNNGTTLNLNSMGDDSNKTVLRPRAYQDKGYFKVYPRDALDGSSSGWQTLAPGQEMDVFSGVEMVNFLVHPEGEASSWQCWVMWENPIIGAPQVSLLLGAYTPDPLDTWVAHARSASGRIEHFVSLEDGEASTFECVFLGTRFTFSFTRKPDGQPGLHVGKDDSSQKNLEMKLVLGAA